MSERAAFRARLRVRIGKGLTTDEPRLTVKVFGRAVTIKPRERDQTLRQAKWIVLTAGGFETEAAAHEFGKRLRGIVEIAALSTRLGVDSGQDRPTAWVNEEWARGVGLIQPDERLMPDVHGLMVMPDDDLTRMPQIKAEATVTADAAQFVSGINELGREASVFDAAASAGVRILNLALINREPLTQIVLAFSAVEALGQDETWTERQRTLLNALATQVDSDAEGDAEQREVAEVLRRSLHRIGLRQGVMRVLSRLGLEHLRNEWDRIYALRSGAFHGTAPLTESEMNALAQAAITLCGKVILAVVSREGVPVPSIAKTHFPD